MRKKLALIIISMDECFPEKGFSGGGHKVTKNLILGLVESNLFDIDIYTKKGSSKTIQGINSVTVLGKKDFDAKLKEKLAQVKYNYVLSSDILLPFANNLVHSNSSRHKSKNGKNKFMQLVLNLYNHKKIRTQEKNLPKDKTLFTVSESLKQDFCQNFNLDEEKVFVCHPAVDDYLEFCPPEKKEVLTFGGIAGGGLNKGGYLLVMAMKFLPKECRLKARIIFPKIKKALFFKLFVVFLGLGERVEILPKQSDMQKYYESIDCYVLPSLNEAFGLVVTEAASKFKPSIVSSTTGVSELINDGQNGFAFNRIKTPVKNLTHKLKEVCDIYFNNYDKFIEISKKSHEISTKLDWKKFSQTIINNLTEEKID